MQKIFVDDKRIISSDLGYNIARTYNEAIRLFNIFHSAQVLHLDYDLGEEKTGLDILKYVVEKNIKVEKIFIHSTHEEGVKEMERFIQDNLNDVEYTYCPM